MDIGCVVFEVSVTFAGTTKVTEELADALSFGGPKLRHAHAAACEKSYVILSV